MTFSLQPSREAIGKYKPIRDIRKPNIHHTKPALSVSGAEDRHEARSFLLELPSVPLYPCD